MSRPDEKNGIARIFACRTVAVMHFTGRIESLKPFIVSGVLWSVQSISPTETQKSLFCVRLVVTSYISLFQTGTDRNNGILMSLLILVAETKISEKINVKADLVITSLNDILFSKNKKKVLWEMV